MMKNELPLNPETCPRCMVGRIKQRPVTLSEVIDGYLLSIPNFPAWMCDICHAFMYDPVAMDELHTFLTSKPDAKQKTKYRATQPSVRQIQTVSKKISESRP